MLATAPETELDYDPNERRPVLRLVKHAGRRAGLRWEWVEDNTATETGAERHARLLADTRMVDMHGLAKLTLRSYATIKDMRHEADAQRTIAANARRELDPGLAASYERVEQDMLVYAVNTPEWDDAEQTLADLDRQIIEQATARAAAQTGEAGDAIAQALFRLNEALAKLLTAIPRERDEQGQSPLWSVGDGVRWRRRSKKNNIWGEKEETRGRPKGSSTRAHTKPLSDYAGKPETSQE